MLLRPLADDTLMARLSALVGQERENVADIIEHLAEIDRREIVIDQGYSSLFEYCIKCLGYTEASAYYRIRAARAVLRFPRILDDLRIGRIHLEAIARLSPHLNNENCNPILDKVAGASKREVLSLVAQISGAETIPQQRDIIRYLPTPPPVNTTDSPVELHEIIAPPPRIRLSFTANDEFLKMLERLRSMRRHKFPEGRLEDILGDAASNLLNRLGPRSRKSGQKCPSGRPTRRISLAIKTQIWKRDGGRCAYLAIDGRRCGSHDFLEYDHVMPWASGGRSDHADNIRLLCRAHNQRLARLRFGDKRRI